MENILEVYQRSYDETHPLICVDESSKQHLKETRQPIPAQPGSVEKYDTEYERNGVSSLFMFFEPLAGESLFLRKLLWASQPNKRQKLRDRSCLRRPQPSCFSR